MIEPIDDTETTKQNFIVADIENFMPSGKLICIGTSYRWSGEIKHEVHDSWSIWFDRILQLAERDKKFRTVYAHNGGGWDWLHLLEWLLKQQRFRYWKIEGQRVASKIVILRVHVIRKDANTKNGSTTRYCLRFVDSLYLLRSKLSILSAKFLGDDYAKLELGGKLPHEIYAVNRELFYRYLERDCEALLLVLEKTLHLLRSKIARIDSLGMTIGSTAMKVWRTGYLNRTISIPTTASVKEHLREGYRGGRVEVFQYGEFKSINVYDVNSLYPMAMKTCKVPVSDRGDWTGIVRFALPGCYTIRYTQHRRDIPPVLMVNATGAYEGEGTFFTPELALLREVDPRSRIEVVKGYTFYEQDFLFSNYVDALYALRLEHSGGPVDLLAKYLLNSLYGKLAQRAEREQYVVFSDISEAIDAIKKAAETPVQKRDRYIELNLQLGVWAVTHKTDVSFEHVGIAGMITSQARVLLYRGLMAAGNERVVYCDTDSVHTTGRLPPSFIGTDLGLFKHEFAGRGVYCGRKLYALQAADGKEKVRAKGVSVGGPMGCRLGYADMVRVSQGEIIECNFQQPTTANEVMSNKPACVFQKRKRRIRITGNGQLSRLN